MIINILIFVVVFSLLILVHEFGHFISAKIFGMKVEEFGLGFPPRLFKIKRGETVYSINAIPIGGFVKILGEEGNNESNNSGEKGDNTKKIENKQDANRSFSSKPIWKRVIVLSAGVFMNFLIGFLLLIPVFTIGVPNNIVISSVAKNSPAYSSGIEVGDFVKGFNNVDNFIKYVKSNAGKSIVLKIKRAGKNREITVIPRKNPPKGEGAIGIGLSGGGIKGRPIYKAIWISLKESVSMFVLIFVMILKIIGSIFTKSNVISNVAGPVGIYKATVQAAGMGWIYLASFVALISINLAALNIFPFPALDGGRIVFLAIEKIKKSPINIRIQQWVNLVGFASLIILLIIVTMHDLFYR